TSQMIKECTKPGVVALTFDDGPHDNTPQILDVLSKKGVKATFFFIGSNVAGKEAIVKRAYDEGHQIASHTWSHPGLPELSADGIKEEMQKTEDALEKAFGKKVRYMRNPRLEENQVAMDTLNGMDYVQVGVNLDTNDWRDDRKANPSLILGTYTDTMASADPASQSFITLQHDHTNFADAKVGEAIDAIKAKGFTFVTSEECL
ncbi:glycoside hydrolase/deacetylase, partial [Neoconidiobolus thromboides FSU 785]